MALSLMLSAIKKETLQETGRTGIIFLCLINNERGSVLAIKVGK
jgi:hypothetical protein